MLFNLSSLNSKLTLTLGYLNPALNNSALAPVVLKLDSPIHWINIRKPITNSTIQWIEIYPVDSAIHLLNWDLGLLLGRDKTGQQLIGASPAMIPQIIAGYILAPVPFPFQMYWRCEETQLNINELLVLLLNKLHSVVDGTACWMYEK